MNNVNINRNFFRVLNIEFLYLQPVRLGRFHVGGLYTVESEKYGKLGVAECTGINECHVYELRETVLMLSEADKNWPAKMNAKGVLSTDLVQYCRFHFKRRYDKAIGELINGELIHIGVEIVHQGTLILT